MTNIRFTCINDTTEPWQDEILRRLNSDPEQGQKVLAADAEFRAMLPEILERTSPGYMATAIEDAMRKVHCIQWIKNVGPDRDYDVEINHLRLTVEFCEHL